MFHYLGLFIALCVVVIFVFGIVLSRANAQDAFYHEKFIPNWLSYYSKVIKLEMPDKAVATALDREMMRDPYVLDAYNFELY